MAYELSPEAEKALEETPKIRAMAEELIAKDGGKTFEAVRTYLQFKQKINEEKDEKKRQQLVELAANIMAIYSATQGLEAEDIVAAAENLAKVGIAELASVKPIVDGPSTLQ